jgi:Protein of unknown function (DUF3037)
VFEYALVRVVPRGEHRKAVNTGVIVYPKPYRCLRTRIELNEARLLALDPGVSRVAVRATLSAFERACTQGPFAGRPLGERFGWLTAPRSSVVQPCPRHMTGSPMTPPPSWTACLALSSGADSGGIGQPTGRWRLPWRDATARSG